MSPVSAALVFGFVALHMGAIACAWGTRLAVGSRAEGAIQLLFLVALAAVGFATWFCHQHDSGLGIPSGMTLMAMAMMAVVDFRRTHEPANRGTVPLHR